MRTATSGAIAGLFDASAPRNTARIRIGMGLSERKLVSSIEVKYVRVDSGKLRHHTEIMLRVDHF